MEFRGELFMMYADDEDETAFGLGYGGEFKNGTLFKLQASKSGDASGVGLTISF